jgi:hypothetical protein
MNRPYRFLLVERLPADAEVLVQQVEIQILFKQRREHLDLLGLLEAASLEVVLSDVHSAPGVQTAKQDGHLLFLSDVEHGWAGI